MRLMTYNNQYPVIPGPLSPSNPIFIKLELLKIEEIFKYYISKFIFKCLLQLTPINFHSWFTASSGASEQGPILILNLIQTQKIYLYLQPEPPIMA